jgi:phosphatidylserine/phosphatidylglycerophosphate/cardiolipin synthase-like enzyme
VVPRPGRRGGAPFHSAAPLLAALVAAACGAAGGDRAPGGPGRAPATPAPAASAPAAIELVESAPVETTLDHADLRDAADVWPALVDGARRTLDVAQFYASEATGEAARASRLAPVVAAIGRAAARGVRVRFLADASFAGKYPDTLARLRDAGATVLTLDVGKFAGGVLHAKYFVVDGVESFLGSQNFDWRALAHIQEVGVRVRSDAFAGALLDVFEADWALASGAPPPGGRARRPPAAAATGEAFELVASPRGWLPDERSWDLPALERLLDGAARAVDLQLLTYSVKNRDGGTFVALDDALRRAGARGVRVRLLVSHWAAKPGGEARRSLEALARAPGVEVRVLTVPPWSGGDVPFARVAHAKYLVVDGGRGAWVGTSNWEGDYFLRSRNVGVVVRGGALGGRLAGVFEDGWAGPYARPLAPAEAADGADGASGGRRSPTRPPRAAATDAAGGRAPVED